MKRRIFIAVILLAILLLGGCAGMEIQSSSITLAGIEVIEAGLGEAVLDVTAVTGFASIVRQINAVSRGSLDAISYRIKGRLVTGSSYGMNFDERGKLEMSKPVQGR